MGKNISNSLKGLSKISGFIAAAVVDSDSGMTFGTIGGGDDFDIEVAAAANTDVVTAKLRAAEALNLEDSIDDILITLSTQYHLIRPLPEQPQVFVYLAVNRDQANLAMARMTLSSTAKELTL